MTSTYSSYDETCLDLLQLWAFHTYQEKYSPEEIEILLEQLPLYILHPETKNLREIKGSYNFDAFKACFIRFEASSENPIRKEQYVKLPKS